MSFHEIFSKEKITQIEKPKIIVDYREKNCMVISELVSLGLDVQFQTLKVGDYLFNETVIERKTVRDFVSSMINRRLFRQLEEMKQYNTKILIVEGIEEQELYNDDNERVNANAIRGMILSVLLNYQIPIIFSKNEEDTALFINVLARKQKKKHFLLNPKKKSFDEHEQKQFIIEAFPGIGPATAKKLLKEFGSIKRIINTPIEELQKIIGKKADIFKIAE
jgi:Fanconi anemia group M protein